MTTETQLNQPADSPSGALRRMAVLLFLLFGASYAYFTQSAHNYNVLCRAALTANIVQHGRIDINGYEAETADKSFFAGNFYCDKAPGMSFLALPAAYLYTRLVPITVEDERNRSARAWRFFVYLCAVSTSGLLAAAAGTVLYLYLAGTTGNHGAALVGSLTFGLGTPIWGWATSLFSHAAMGALLLIGFVGLDAARRRVVGGKGALVPAAVGGAMLGAATAVDYSAFVAALIMGVCIAGVSPWRDKAGPMLAVFAVAAVAAVCMLLPVLVYQNAAFGSPFVPGYQHAVDFTETRVNFGLAPPDPTTIMELIFGAKRGLIWISPVMVASVWATVRVIQQGSLRMPAVMALGVMTWFIVFNAGFAYWQGGWTTGPRYLAAGMGIMAMPLALAWPATGSGGRWIVGTLLIVSIAINLACTAVGMDAPGPLANPLTEWTFPGVVEGQFRTVVPWLLTGRDSLRSVVPLLLVWGVLGWLIWREYRRSANILT